VNTRLNKNYVKPIFFFYSDNSFLERKKVVYLNKRHLEMEIKIQRHIDH